ncbi:hypothetical protein EWH99_03430 [Sporolactobacillus sp. THM7-7]|nr:hypothetical protein EWH99_03430 [Sporolactobacillus sp. THM7-7]
MTDFTFTLKGEWKGSWDGTGLIRTKGIETDISVDTSMKGRSIGTNPDELLLSALASCYMITLGIRLEKEQLAYDHISIRTTGVVTKKGGLHFEKVVHKPVIFVPGKMTQKRQEQLLKAVRQAEQDCMVAKAVYGNVRVTVEPVFETFSLN